MKQVTYLEIDISFNLKDSLFLIHTHHVIFLLFKMLQTLSILVVQTNGNVSRVMSVSMVNTIAMMNQTAKINQMKLDVVRYISKLKRLEKLE